EIESQLSKRKLGSLVQLELSGNILTIFIKRLGTSQIRFQVSDVPCDQTEGPSSDSSTEVMMIDKRIAFSHRFLEKEIIAKLEKVIYRSGGKIITPYVT
ncbi:MAG: hypothetical protein OXC40_02205, partial [Proteobacteria bacterium]|nr:hypothetical protein [Pseudomonadota bacterium]